MKIFTEILKATLLSFIVSYSSFVVQTNIKIVQNYNEAKNSNGESGIKFN